MSTIREIGTHLEIVNQRVFAAPRAVVFEAFANPNHLVVWWGPNGFTNTVQEFDFRPGGAFRITLHGPDGKSFENDKRFTEIVIPEKIVFDHFEPMHHFQMTMLFTETGDGKTDLTWRMLFDSAAQTEPIQHFIADANEQNFDRLAAHLVKMQAARG